MVYTFDGIIYFYADSTFQGQFLLNSPNPAWISTIRRGAPFPYFIVMNGTTHFTFIVGVNSTIGFEIDGNGMIFSRFP